MNRRVVSENDVDVTVIHSDEVLIYDTQSALDFIASVSYGENCDRAVLNKAAIAEDVFVLSNGVAGDILQKFVNYSMKLAIHGDFNRYTSEPLKAFIYECNRGNQIFFVDTERKAVERLIQI